MFARSRWWLRGLIAGSWLALPLLLPGVAHARDSTEYRSEQGLDQGLPNEARRLVAERTFAARPMALELRTGLATIVGLLGPTVSFDPWSRMSLGAGVGINTSGLQFAGFARFRPLVFMAQRTARLHAVGVELGYSVGPFEDHQNPLSESGPVSTFSYDRVQWLQPQVTYETRSFKGFNLLAGLGVAIPVKTTGYHCLDEPGCNMNHIGGITTVTFAIGYALQL